MEVRKYADILGARVDLVNTRQAMERIKSFIAKRQSAHVITLNAEIVYQAQDNPELLKIINGADLVTPDGIGIVWAGRHLGYAFEERVSGIDLLELLCEQAPQKNWKIYLLGAAPGVADEAARQLTLKYPGIDICGTQHGYFTAAHQQSIVEVIQQLQPDILFVGLGAPGQEIWIHQFQLALAVPVAIGVGGSFDVVAGIKSRAPQWVIKANLEWLYRLLKEPRRLKRQLALPRFVWAVLRQKKIKN
ncbi:MAG TPA: WecB/TagA/CpsF family glycosyltransferase [Syntrophomonas sp.]|nr:WecB/TagA/CpsF family glycosyltransferase [Syntrophomonas sp.]HRW11686.1 WecB/TagA/CpsF family glycosyltransferase [Syntrophomonas sp.]